MCTHNKDNEWYIYLRNKDTMSQSLPNLVEWLIFTFILQILYTALKLVIGK